MVNGTSLHICMYIDQSQRGKCYQSYWTDLSSDQLHLKLEKEILCHPAIFPAQMK